MNIPSELLNEDMAFHYTKSSVAMEDMLYNERIRFSSFINMNDPYEYKIPTTGMTNRGGKIPNDIISKASSLLKNVILHKSKILSLVRNKDEDIIDYFKQLADETGIPYQNLINLYLRDCVQAHRKLSMKWAS